MSAWVHCNRCCAMAINGVSFCLTSCGHIVCESCLKMAGAMPGQKGPCIVCKKPGTGIMQINRSMRPDILAMFRPPKDIVVECNRKMNSVIEFQAGQSQRLIKQLYEKLTKTTKFAREAQAEIKKRGEKVQLLEAERNQHIAELGKAKERIHQLENCLAEREQEIQRLKHQQHKSPGRLGTPSPHKRDYRFPSLNGETPLNSLTFFGCVASTPYENVPTNSSRGAGGNDAGSALNLFNTPQAREESTMAAGGFGFTPRPPIPSTPDLFGYNQRTRSTVKHDYF